MSISPPQNLLVTCTLWCKFFCKTLFSARNVRVLIWINSQMSDKRHCCLRCLLICQITSDHTLLLYLDWPMHKNLLTALWVIFSTTYHRELYNGVQQLHSKSLSSRFFSAFFFADKAGSTSVFSSNFRQFLV